MITQTTFTYLQSYRKRTGISSKDMASMIGIDAGNLSKMEAGKREPSIFVVIAYHLILNIPFHRLLKNQYKEAITGSLRNAIALKDQLLGEMTTPTLNHTVILLDTIIDRLIECDKKYV
jgi:transcriptional regulator with XRE-family HTH domain